MWLPIASYKSITLIPVSEINGIELLEPGWTDARSALCQAWITDKLRKRYGAYADADVPSTVKRWMVAMLDRDVYTKRGRNPQDPAMTDVNREAEEALAQLDLAANSQQGLIELPIVQGTDVSGVNHGGPIFYSEASPFVSADRQQRAAATECGEDERGDGTYGGV
jgi:hypothetical protein